jgi:hypothetical protein
MDDVPAFGEKTPLRESHPQFRCSFIHSSSTGFPQSANTIRPEQG